MKSMISFMYHKIQVTFTVELVVTLLLAIFLLFLGGGACLYGTINFINGMSILMSLVSIPIYSELITNNM